MRVGRWAALKSGCWIFCDVNERAPVLFLALLFNFWVWAAVATKKGLLMNDTDFDFQLCRLPAALRKALIDRPFDYALKLTDGQVIFFAGAVFDRANPEWIHLEMDQKSVRQMILDKPGVAAFKLGLDVRISSIVWCADAPFGS
jgi:hypothetical protein